VAPLDQKIGKALSISEVETSHFPPVYKMERLQAAGDMGTQETLAPGEMEVRARVTVGFQLF
jgi:uncharacterized protein